jgi:[ribosomal protein S5]-alanine N-acetyltransferase
MTYNTKRWLKGGGAMNVRIDISETILETPRLYIRPWKITDLDDFYEYASVDGVGQMAGWKPHENKEESRKILNLFIEEKKTYALELKENGRAFCME